MGTRDILAEAEVAMVYGRYDQAQELLQNGLAAHPGDPELRVKLLEVFYATKDRAAFESLASDLRDLLPGEDDPLWQKAAQMGRDLCPGVSLFAAPAGGEEGGIAPWGSVEELMGVEAARSEPQAQDRSSDGAAAQWYSGTEGIDFEWDLEIPKSETGEVNADDEAVTPEADEMATKLELARAYLDLGDHNGAREFISEVLAEGTELQKQEAQGLMARL
jgi:pilus assembly protein FimV